MFSRVSERQRDEKFDRTWIGKIKKINKKKCRKKKKKCMDLKKNAMNFITYSLSHINLRNLTQRVFAKNCRFVLEDWVFLPAPRALVCSHGWQAAGAPQGPCAASRIRGREGYHPAAF